MDYYVAPSQWGTPTDGGEFSYGQFRERLYNAICQFAKRQMTFFRKMEKDGVAIHWLSAESSSLRG